MNIEKYKSLKPDAAAKQAVTDAVGESDAEYLAGLSELPEQRRSRAGAWRVAGTVAAVLVAVVAVGTWLLLGLGLRNGKIQEEDPAAVDTDVTPATAGDHNGDESGGSGAPAQNNAGTPKGGGTYSEDSLNGDSTYSASPRDQGGSGSRSNNASNGSYSADDESQPEPQELPIRLIEKLPDPSNKASKGINGVDEVTLNTMPKTLKLKLAGPAGDTGFVNGQVLTYRSSSTSDYVHYAHKYQNKDGEVFIMSGGDTYDKDVLLPSGYSCAYVSAGVLTEDEVSDLTYGHYSPPAYGADELEKRLNGYASALFGSSVKNLALKILGGMECDSPEILDADGNPTGKFPCPYYTYGLTVNKGDVTVAEGSATIFGNGDLMDMSFSYNYAGDPATPNFAGVTKELVHGFAEQMYGMKSTDAGNYTDVHLVNAVAAEVESIRAWLLEGRWYIEAIVTYDVGADYKPIAHLYFEYVDSVVFPEVYQPSGTGSVLIADFASNVIPKDLQDMKEQASNIVICTVTDESNSDSPICYADVTVEKVIKGDLAAGDLLTVTETGIRYDDHDVSLENVPLMRKKMRVVLFLGDKSMSGKYGIIANYYGKLFIDGSGTVYPPSYFSRSAGTVADFTEPMPLDKFLALL